MTTTIISSYLKNQNRVSTHRSRKLLRLIDDSMEAPLGISFPKGTYIFLDPNRIPLCKDFVIAQLAKDKPVIFRQLIARRHKYFLRPLNLNYPLIEVTSQVIICGVIYQLLRRF